jgi:predicted HicB family RNase H-like nuclease
VKHLFADPGGGSWLPLGVKNDISELGLTYEGIKMLRYKGYTGIVEYDTDGKIFTGEVVDLYDVITFQGRTPAELEQSFRDSIDFYLEMCAQDHRQPEKSFSGRFNVRLTPDLHRKIAVKAVSQNISLNQLVVEALKKEVME